MLLSLVAFALAQDPVEPPPGEAPPPEHVEDAEPEVPADAIDPNAVGVMVRVTVAEGEPDPTAVVLVGSNGKTSEIPVRDDGTEGDVEAGDRIWAGSMWLVGEDFDVSIATSSGPIEAGKVSWAPDDETRDLLVTVDATQVSAQALVSKPLPEQPGEQSPPEPGGEGVAPAGGPAGAGGGAGGTLLPQPSGGGALGTGGDSDDGGGPLRIAGLVFGLLALGAAIWWWRQSAGGGGGDLDEPLPEPGLLGDTTPAIGNALTVWVVSADDAPALVGPLLGAVARHRPVVVSSPASFRVPPVYGGPVYGAGSLDDLADQVEALGSGAAGFLVVNAPDVEALAEAEEARSKGTGLVVLAIGGAARPGDVTCSRNGQRWILKRGEDQVVVRAGPYGLVHPDNFEDE